MPHAATAHVVSGLDRQVLDAADLGFVLEEPESAAAVGAVYRRLDRDGLIEAEWWGEDLLPLEATLTPMGRSVLRAAGR